jgi:hypothetical protein
MAQQGKPHAEGIVDLYPAQGNARLQKRVTALFAKDPSAFQALIEERKEMKELCSTTDVAGAPDKRGSTASCRNVGLPSTGGMAELAKDSYF